MMPITMNAPATGKADSREGLKPLAGRRNVLRIQGLRKSFDGQVVLNGATADLREGEVVLLRGDNGSGKTTLLNILSGNLEPDAGSIHLAANGTTEHFEFPRRWWQNLNPFDHFTPERVAREGVGRTWQDVRLFGSQTLRDNIAVATPGHLGENPILALLAPNRGARREGDINREAHALLARLGLNGRDDSSADMISLGQSKRVAIARAVAAGARILFLDEPLAGLDRQGIIDVIAFLKSLARERNLTLVIVEHVSNQSHLDGLVTTDWLLEGGKLHRNGTVSRNLQAGTSGQRLPLVNRPAWFDLLAGDGAEVIDESLPCGAFLTRIRRPDRFQSLVKPALEIRDLVVKRGLRTITGLDGNGNATGFHLAIYKGEIAILQAPNGWGKSTLFAAICGLLPASSGSIYLDGQSLDGLPAWQRADRGLRALPSDRHTFAGLNVNDYLSLAGVPDHSQTHEGTLHRSCSSLSGGERQWIAFLGMIAATGQPSQFVMDEPFAAFDRKAIEQAIKTIRDLPSASILILAPAAHDLKS